LSETNNYYKEKVGKFEQEIQLRMANEEHFRQKIGILEAELKRLRESELSLRLFAEQVKTNQIKKPLQTMTQEQAVKYFHLFDIRMKQSRKFPWMS
jgi:RNA binding exosome subunit